MVFIGFFIMMVFGVLMTLAGLIYVKVTVAFGSGGGEQIFALIVLGLGLYIIYLACKLSPLSLVVS